MSKKDFLWPDDNYITSIAYAWAISPTISSVVPGSIKPQPASVSVY